VAAHGDDAPSQPERAPSVAATPQTEAGRRAPSTRARIIGTVLAVLVTCVVVAYPLLLAALFTVVEWTGCFIECREPDPNPVGAVASGMVALLLPGLPVLVGVLSWRGSSRRLVVVFAGLALLSAAVWALGLAI
jgi:hypothetical protein